MSARSLDLVTHWRLHAPVDLVWAALTDAERWPLWWPQVRSVRTLRAGGADGLGSVRRIDWSTRLPCDLVIEIEATEALRHERLRVRSRGRLRGEGIWLLQADGAFTDVTALWRIELQRPWMRRLAPLLAPLLRWNHDGVMRAGAAGLAHHLAASETQAAR